MFWREGSVWEESKVFGREGSAWEGEKCLGWRDEEVEFSSIGTAGVWVSGGGNEKNELVKVLERRWSK